MTSIEFQCCDHPVVASFRTDLTPAQVQRLKIMSRSTEHRCADICEQVANLADGWGNPVHFALPARKMTVLGD